MNFTTRLTAVILLFLLCTCKGDNMGGDEISLGERLELASQYSNEHEGDAFLVMKDGGLFMKSIRMVIRQHNCICWRAEAKVFRVQLQFQRFQMECLLWKKK